MTAFLFALIFLFPQTSLAADYSNDSDSININYTGSEPDAPSQGSGSGGAGGGADGTGTASGSGGGGGATGGNGAPLPDTEVTVTVTAGGSGGSSLDSSAATGSEILSTLLGNQAVFFGGGGAGGGVGGSGGEVSLSAEDVRKALAARGVSKLTLSRFLSERFRTKGDFALAAASSILDNPSLEKVVLSARDMSLTYKANGRLLGVFPFAYPIRLEVHPYEKTPETRIGVKFPWYRFFLQTYVTKRQLQTELDAVLSSALADTEETDQAARALLVISTAIQERFDTVEGTLLKR